MAQTSNEWAVEICEAMGLDPKAVTRVELVLDARRLAVLTVTMHPDKSEAVVALLREAGKHVNHVTIEETPRGGIDAL